MRTYLDIPLTLIVTTVLTVAIRQSPTEPDGTDKLAHLIAFAALAFPLARTGRFGLVAVFLGTSILGVS